MTQQQKNNAMQRQALRKYVVFAIMFLAFGGIMWLIFAPSGSEREARRQGAGFNADIPEPKDEGIATDKKTAYEQEQVRLKQEERMRTLQDYSFMLGSTDGGQGDYQGENVKASMPAGNPYPDGAGNPFTGNQGVQKSRTQNPFEASSTAYMDLNKTLGNFYDIPGDDPEKEALREEIKQLKSAMAAQPVIQPSYDEQAALLEKSYELAAKYMAAGAGRDVPGSVRDDAGGGESKKGVAPVSQIREQVVSSLWQRIPDMETEDQSSRERNPGFNTVAVRTEPGVKNTINAVIHGDQTLVDGQGVNLRTVEAMQAGEHVIPRNTVLTGIGKISGERLEIMVTSIAHEGNIMAVNIKVYDSDGQPGIYIPGSMELNALKEVAGNMGQNLGSSINITQQSAGQQLLADLGRGAIQGTSQYISKKTREVKVTLKAGYRVFLLPGDNN